MVRIQRAGNDLEILKHWLRNKVDGTRSTLKACILGILNDTECYINDNWYIVPTKQAYYCKGKTSHWKASLKETFKF